jgi:GMP synthase-like glutamine amidotransferase
MILIVQNDIQVPAGTLTDFLDRRKYPFQTIRLFDGDAFPEWEHLTGIVVLGGSMGVNDESEFPFMNGLKKWIQSAVTLELPFMGICLGGQLLAGACSGQVKSHHRGEHGCREVHLNNAGKDERLFQGLPETFISYQWHQDSFIPPEDAIVLAVSPDCPYQAFRVGKRAWGLQFHPEVDGPIVSDWAREHVRKDEFVSQFQKMEQIYRDFSRKIFSNFLSVVLDFAATPDHPATEKTKTRPSHQ